VIITGDALTELKKLDSGIVQTCITSPPYWGLRDYGVEGQIGLEDSPEAYVSTLVEVFAEVKRVLKGDGTLWLVLGDSYAANRSYQVTDTKWREVGNEMSARVPNGLKPKDLVGIPWRAAFALQSDGWWLRSDIIWHKPNPMPESVTDRPTSAHEHVFLLAKSARYYYDGPAIREPAKVGDHPRNVDCTYTAPGQKEQQGLRKSGLRDKQRGHGRRHAGFNERWDSMTRNEQMSAGANKRNVWTVATQPYPEAHFSVYPPVLIEPCVLAGSREGDTVLDPFCGSGTTGEVALKHRRKFIGIELNPEYVKLAEKRLREVQVAMF
jgi:DNA modification methylase